MGSTEEKISDYLRDVPDPQETELSLIRTCSLNHPKKRLRSLRKYFDQIVWYLSNRERELGLDRRETG